MENFICGSESSRSLVSSDQRGHVQREDRWSLTLSLVHIRLQLNHNFLSILRPLLLLRLRQMRCPEIDFRSTWKWALPVLDLVESSQDLPTLTSDNDRENDSGSSGSGPSRLRLIKDGLKGSAKETYLKRMLVAAHQWQVGRDWFAM